MEMQGQFSDGFWENSSDNWRNICSLGWDDVIVDENKHGVDFKCPQYKTQSNELIDVVGMRILYKVNVILSSEKALKMCETGEITKYFYKIPESPLSAYKIANDETSVRYDEFLQLKDDFGLSVEDLTDQYILISGRSLYTDTELLTYSKMQKECRELAKALKNRIY